jgi:hypothetical protein
MYMFLSVNLVYVPPFQLLKPLNDFHGAYVHYAVGGHLSAVEVQEKLVPLIVQYFNFVFSKNVHLFLM